MPFFKKKADPIHTFLTCDTSLKVARFIAEDPKLHLPIAQNVTYNNKRILYGNGVELPDNAWVKLLKLGFPNDNAVVYISASHCVRVRDDLPSLNLLFNQLALELQQLTIATAMEYCDKRSENEGFFLHPIDILVLYYKSICLPNLAKAMWDGGIVGRLMMISAIKDEAIQTDMYKELLFSQRSQKLAIGMDETVYKDIPNPTGVINKTEFNEYDKQLRGYCRLNLAATSVPTANLWLTAGQCLDTRKLAQKVSVDILQRVAFPPYTLTELKQLFFLSCNIAYSSAQTIFAPSKIVLYLVIHGAIRQQFDYNQKNIDGLYTYVRSRISRLPPSRLEQYGLTDFA